MMLTAEKRKKMEDLIYKFFTAFDSSGSNTKYYKDQFQNMSDSEFDKFFKQLFANENAYLILNIKDYQNTITLDNIQKAANVLGIPLMEYVWLPHITMDKSHVISTREKVPVGYLNIKRTQQTVSKKNGMSTNINARSSTTGQVSGSDKNGRESDLENSMLLSIGLDKTIQELCGPRADDNVMKNQMLRDISLNGYVSLNDLTNNVENKTTLNTVNTYLLGMGINSDLVTTGLMLKSTIKEEL